MILTHRSGFALTDADGHEIVHVLPCRLWIPGGAYGDVEPLFRSVALDQTTIHVEQFTGGAEELQGRIRFHGDPDALRALLREGARGRTLTYYPDLAVPAEAYPVVLMDAGAVVQFGTDGARAAYGEWEVPVTLRRIDGGSLAPLASGLLVQIGPAGPMTGATFTRATTGTRISAARRIESIAAGLRRVTWLEINGILRPFTLLEAARTNAWTRSEEFDHADWSKSNVSVSADVTTAPDGAATADKLIEDAQAGSAHIVQRAFAAATDNTFQSVSFVAKAAERSWCAIRIATKNGISIRVWFDLASGAKGTEENGMTGTIEPLEDGWYRVTGRASVGSGGGTGSAGLALAPADNVFAYDGDAASGCYLWAGQYEADKEYATSYIPTIAAAATRNADQWSIPYTHAPMAASYAVRFIEQGMPPWVTAAGVSPRIFELGGTGAPRLYILKVIGADTYLLGHNPVTGSTALATLDLNPAHGDLIELVAELYADGAVRLHGRKNGGAITSTAKSAAQPFAAAWAAATLRIGGQDAAGTGDIGFGGLVARRGTGHDFDRLLARIPGGV